MNVGSSHVQQNQGCMEVKEGNSVFSDSVKKIQLSEDDLKLLHAL